MSVTIKGTDTSAAAPSFTGSDGDTGLYFPAAGQAAIATNGTQALFINDTQDVGIGTNTPFSTNGTNLEIASSTTARLLLNQTSTRLWSLGAGSNQFNIYDETAGAERFKIDSSGRVATPYQPALAVSNTATAAGNITGGTVYFDVTSAYNTSNGRFTAPVTGTYVAGITVYVSGTDLCEVGIYKNGALWAWFFQKNYTGGSSEGLGGAQLVQLNAGDYITWYNNKGNIRGSGDDHRWAYFLG